MFRTHGMKHIDLYFSYSQLMKFPICLLCYKLLSISPDQRITLHSDFYRPYYFSVNTNFYPYIYVYGIKSSFNKLKYILAYNDFLYFVI